MCLALPDRELDLLRFIRVTTSLSNMVRIQVRILFRHLCPPLTDIMMIVRATVGLEAGDLSEH
jgi:hypothetical protein